MSTIGRVAAAFTQILYCAFLLFLPFLPQNRLALLTRSLLRRSSERQAARPWKCGRGSSRIAGSGVEGVITDIIATGIVWGLCEDPTMPMI